MSMVSRDIYKLTCIVLALAELLAQRHKVALGVIHLVFEASLGRVLARTGNLEIVVVHTSDPGA